MKDHQIADYRAMFAALQVLGANPETGTPQKPATENRAGLHRLERENALLIDHAEMLACALGACPNCWGTIPDCEDCHGVGKPGAFNPDRSCFDHFVLPVIIRILGRNIDNASTPSDGTGR